MFEKVCEILADKFDADASTMTMDTKVKEDLNADSLDVVELMMDKNAPASDAKEDGRCVQ